MIETMNKNQCESPDGQLINQSDHTLQPHRHGVTLASVEGRDSPLAKRKRRDALPLPAGGGTAHFLCETAARWADATARTHFRFRGSFLTRAGNHHSAGGTKSRSSPSHQTDKVEPFTVGFISNQQHRLLKCQQMTNNTVVQKIISDLVSDRCKR